MRHRKNKPYQRVVTAKIKEGKVNTADGNWRPIKDAEVDEGYMQT